MLNNFIIDLDDFRIIKQIGEGKFAIVYLVENKKKLKQCAAKVNKNKCNTTNDQKTFFAEIEVYSKTNYPSILTFIGYNMNNFQLEPFPTIVTEYMPHGSLDKMLESVKLSLAPIEWTDTKRYIVLLGIALGVRNLHLNGIIHRDLKPANILLDENFYPRICDFGFSKLTPKQITDFTMSSGLGTPFYMAPECFTGEEYTFKVDVFAFGRIAYELVTHERKPIKIPEKIAGKSNQEFFRRCFSATATERPDFTEICKFMVKKSFIDLLGNVNNDEVLEFLEKFEEIQSDVDLIKHLNNQLEQNEEINDDDDDESNNLNDDEYNDEDGEIIKIAGPDSVNYKLYNKNDKFISIIGKSPKAKGDIFVPTFVEWNSKQYKIVKIGNEAFSETNINSLSFSDDSAVKIIGESAFEKSKISSLSLPKSLIKIANSWCQGADKLNKITVDEGNPFFTSKKNFLIYKRSSIRKILFVSRNFNGDAKISVEITDIGDSAFSNIDRLVSFESSPNLKTVESYSFCGCKNLKNVSFRNEETLSLGTFCFASSKNLSSVHISSKEVKIYNYCFANCTSLASIEFTDVEKITLDNRVFNGCTNLDNFIVTNASEIKIGEKCFDNLINFKSIGLIADNIYLNETFLSNCTSLSLVNIQCKNGKITIHSNIFKNCRLKNITIYSSKLKLCNGCFQESSNLETIDIRSEDLDIGDKCFQNCRSLAFFTLHYGKDINVSPSTFLGCSSLKQLTLISKSNLIIYNEFSSVSKKNYKVILSGKTIIIGDSCFKNCNLLNEFEIIESGSITIGKNQFTNCVNLRKITIQSSTETEHLIPAKIEFGISCFSGAINLTEIVLIGGDVTISNDCFKSCKSLKKLDIQKSNVVFIDKNQFSDLKSLQTLNIESKSKVIFGENCFSGSSALSIVNIIGKDITIENSCFSNCSSLVQFVIFQTSKITLSKEVFSGCTNLKLIDVYALKELQIEDACFTKSSIEAVNLEAETINIKSGSFKNCKSITRFTISGARDVELGRNAFEGCVNLKIISIDVSSYLKIMNNCFTNSRSLELLGIKCRNINICDQGFSGCSSIRLFDIHDSDKVLLGVKAFDGCKLLERVIITSHEEFQALTGCFYNLSKINRVLITSKKVNFGSYCFANCSSIESLSVLGSEETYINTHSFDNCSKLETVDISGSNKLKISSFCFYKASNLKSVTINSNEFLIGNYCFDKCSLLKQIKAPTAKIIHYFKHSFIGQINCPDTAKKYLITGNVELDEQICVIF